MEEQDTVDQPLLAHSPDNTEDSTSERHGAAVNTAGGVFVWALTFSAGISGLLFGYDTGVISATLVSIKADLSGEILTTMQKSIITSCTSFFALLASPLAGIFADKVGRKNIILVADVLFTIGALVQGLTTTVGGMVVGRSIVGLAVGAASMVSPLYISELAPSQLRGRLVTILSLFITGGQVVAYIIGWLFSSMDGGWRWIVGLGAIPALMQLAILIFLPESPRWLVQAGRSAEAKTVLCRIFGSDPRNDLQATQVLRAIEDDISEEVTELDSNKTSSYERAVRTLVELCRIGGNRRALIIAMMLQGLQQLCGFNSLMYFSATIFQSLSFSSPTLTSLTVAGTNFLFTLLAFSLIDYIGRRRILLFSIPFMILALIGCSFAFSRLDSTHFLSFSGRDSGASSAPLFVLLFITLYTAAYAVGLGNVPWQQSELFPLSVRSFGSALATATNWGSNFIVGLTFLSMMEKLSPEWTFIVYALVCTAGLVTVWYIYPEMSGMDLEEVKDLLSEGWGVEESLKRHHSRTR
ncbi:general substrate transporter [Talaromyces proteolyticus]|uniref:General substrate transporter n=1 Tax=Talaromyces proteolyticus TaxID=1131652 RepID=A0AAD4KNG0_9EURO|nr:general substrate transporter [Talaromyces proteolyticus]KAH8693130.1 general substrate transporter [Talaromyces proteolyticus]